MIIKEYDKDLTEMNTFRMRVKCRLFMEYTSPEDLLEIDFGALPKPVLHIGGGSNLLFSRDFGGTVLHSAVRFIRELPEDGHPCEGKAETLPKDASLHTDMGRGASEAGLTAVPSYRNAVLVSVGAGVKFDDFCAWASDSGFWGPENLSHIPGEAGAAAVQNIGAYGMEAAGIIRQVHCYDIQRKEFVHFDAEECGYGYRDSMFKHPDQKGRYIVTNVIFSLSRKPEPRLDYGHVREAVEKAAAGISAEIPHTERTAGLQDAGQPRLRAESAEGIISPALIRRVIIGIRKEKLPEVEEIGSAGSFFKNPVVPEEVYRHVCEVAAGANSRGIHEEDSPAETNAESQMHVQNIVIRTAKDTAAGDKAANGGKAIVPHYITDAGIKIPAAWLIEQCGWKGYTAGNAGVYDRQPLVIVNATGQAGPEEIIDLKDRITASVQERFGITLQPEVEII